MLKWYYNNHVIATLERENGIEISYTFNSSKERRKMTLEVSGPLQTLINLEKQIGSITNFDKLTFYDSIIEDDIINKRIMTSVVTSISEVGILKGNTYSNPVLNINIDLVNRPE